jgi:Cytochrome c oxidase subunit III
LAPACWVFSKSCSHDGDVIEEAEHGGFHSRVVQISHRYGMKHLGFEFAAWYWHFVDVVWLFLFACIYVWGSWGAAIEH